ncbi:TetR/AcrR family transcriptional regulator [Arthrobacter gengyunqii]|uniref:TetR/AcrR family transcriptional regulator n=1 Tax=Arthrobacter gengyunqii TaxID=2886940 RepID=A0ABS8GJL9_9MICC|nr:TetR/AcrR family transcriptional regulator [Arthrobacter gengyunqii]MCC3266563.1 TetR/AcrR family transcriptional regulator [Arthrobacter gengyunqii]
MANVNSHGNGDVMPTPERTTLAEIVAAGSQILEREGLPRVTMQAVAQRVGVRAPSLYKRVRDRDALIGLVADAAVDNLAGRLDAAEGTLAGIARTYRAFAQERPEAFRLILSAVGDPASPVRVSAPVLRVTEDLVGPEQALDAARLVTAWATGFISMELAGAFRLDGDLEQAFEYGLERLTAALTPAL